MRAITVRQPWAWAIMHGGKDVENRSRNIAGKYLGPIAITAALQVDPQAWLPNYTLQDSTHLAHFTPRGVVLGVVDLTDVHAMWADDDGRCDRCESPWAQRSPYHLTLANPRPLPRPIPVRGRLGLWTLPDDIAAQVEEALQ